MVTDPLSSKLFFNPAQKVTHHLRACVIRQDKADIKTFVGQPSGFARNGGNQIDELLCPHLENGLVVLLFSCLRGTILRPCSLAQLSSHHVSP